MILVVKAFFSVIVDSVCKHEIGGEYQFSLLVDPVELSDSRL